MSGLVLSLRLLWKFSFLKGWYPFGWYPCQGDWSNIAHAAREGQVQAEVFRDATVLRLLEKWSNFQDFKRIQLVLS